MANEMMTDNGKKWIEKEYASKGVAGTALGLSIGALGVELLRNGGLNLGNLLGGNTQPTNTEETAFGLYKGFRDADDQIIAAHNKDSFALYKSQRDNFDCLKAQIDAINTKLAVAESNINWQNKMTMDAIALEAERRACADNKIVNYANSTFAPKYVADFTVGTTSTPQSIYNPLCCNCQ